MSNYLVLTDEDQETPLQSYDFGDVDGGQEESHEFGCLNDLTRIVTAIYARYWPAPTNNGFINSPSGSFPLKSATVIRRDVNGNFQTTVVAKESADAVLTEITAKDKCYTWNGSVFIEQTGSSINFPASSSEILCIGFNDILRAIKFILATPGSYTGLYKKIFDGSVWTDLPVDSTDGTSNLTGSGNLFLGSVTQSLWVKNNCEIETGHYTPEKMFWIIIGCTGVTTQAVGDYQPYGFFSFPYHFLFDQPVFYLKNTGVYTPISSQIFTYCNKGKVAFDADPRGAGDDLVAAYQFKLPQAHTYTLTYLSANQVQVAIDGGTPGAAMYILPNGSTPHYYVILGMDLRFNPGITSAMSTTIQISEMLKHLDYALPDGDDPGDYQNSDLLLGNLNAGAVAAHYIRIAPPHDINLNSNSAAINSYYVGV